MRREMEGLVDALKNKTIDPRSALDQAKLFSLQMRIQDNAFRIETIVKVVEHGTSSVKSVLQTQV